MELAARSLPGALAALVAAALAAAGCAAARPAPARAPAPAAPGETAAAPVASAAPVAPAPGPAAAPRATPPAAAKAPPAPPAPPRPRGRPETLLVGAWTPLDGSRPAGAALAPPAPGGDVVLEFHADGTWSIAGASYQARGTYQWLGADEIEMTIVDSNLPQVGAVSRKRVSVDGTDLALAVEVRVEGRRRLDDVVTRFRRIAGR
jgi:hypothetical protein